jgi:branched-chain amino acid aminotransferase
MARAPLWLDGDVVPWDEVRVGVLSHALQRGAAVFDVGAFRESGKAAGTALLFRPTEHIARFLRSASLVGLGGRWDERWSAEALLAATVRVTGASGAMSGLVRWTAFVPSLEPDVVARPETRASVAIAVITAEDTARPGEPPSAKPAAVRVAVPRDVRKAGPEVFPPQAKVAASYLGPMLAKQRAIAEGFDEVVLLDREGHVAEAPTANVFAVKDGALVTPPVERVLAGITRDSVLAIARAEGIPAHEAHLSPEDLAGADEAFLVATSLPVQAIESIDGRRMPAGAPGPVTARIKATLLACERGEDPRFSAWVVPAR